MRQDASQAHTASAPLARMLSIFASSMAAETSRFSQRTCRRSRNTLPRRTARRPPPPAPPVAMRPAGRPTRADAASDRWGGMRGSPDRWSRRPLHRLARSGTPRAPAPSRTPRSSDKSVGTCVRTCAATSRRVRRSSRRGSKSSTIAGKPPRLVHVAGVEVQLLRSRFAPAETRARPRRVRALLATVHVRAGVSVSARQVMKSARRHTTPYRIGHRARRPGARREGDLPGHAPVPG